MTSVRLSLLTPSGPLTLGNFLGALRPMVARQGDATCFYGIADLHAMTTARDPATLRSLTADFRLLMLAAGLDPARVTLFRQSDVPAHTELAYLLECTAYVGELNRMIQFKEKGRGRPRTRTSLLTYPVLMAADILLYRPTHVPVGDDQRQHVELARDVAQRFDLTYGPAFTVPEITVPPAGARVMDLAEPTRKMSKSTRDGSGVIRMLDAPEVVRRKIGRAVTDSDSGPSAVRADRERKPGVTNLLDLVAACTGGTAETAAEGASTYGTLKNLATEAVVAVLEPVQQRYAELAAAPDHVESVFADGAVHCREVPAPVLGAAREAVGL